MPNVFTQPLRRISRLLLASYVLDWITVVAFFGLAGGFHYIDGIGSRHAFSLQDPSISFPYTEDLISNAMLYVASVVLPAIIIAAICLIAVPFPGSPSAKRLAKGALWRRRVWELNAGWLGLGLAALGAIAITNGLKVATGKPRPHLLAVCDPDLSPEAIARWRVGGLGTSLDSATPIIVTWRICKNTNKGEMENAFSSWPSGHASTSWSGLLYLTMWFCAKFGLRIPSMWSLLFSSQSQHNSNDLSSQRERNSALRNQAAAPPAYLFLFAALPIGTAFYISLSRYFDYRHHGFDIISGAVLGIFCAWIAFHMYQMPIQLGEGWAWAPRRRGAAFGAPVGFNGYGRSDDGPTREVSGRRDGAVDEMRGSEHENSEGIRMGKLNHDIESQEGGQSHSQSNGVSQSSRQHERV